MTRTILTRAFKLQATPEDYQELERYPQLIFVDEGGRAKGELWHVEMQFSDRADQPFELTLLFAVCIDVCQKNLEPQYAFI